MGDRASIGRGIRDRISRTVSSVMLLALERVRSATPVDTGHAMSNWVLSAGSPYTGVCGTREAVDFSAQRAGIAEMREYDVGRDGPAYLRNNVGYLKYLDAGTSQQAPPDFVALAIRGAGSIAVRGTRGRVGKLLARVARAAYNRGHRP